MKISQVFSSAEIPGMLIFDLKFIIKLNKIKII